MISYVLPTRDRPAVLARTLSAIERLGDHRETGGAEVIVVDNASLAPPNLPPALEGGVPVRLLRMERNIAAAARNAGAQASSPQSRWIVMLDDDSYPLDLGLAAALNNAPADTLAVGAEIFLPSGTAAPSLNRSVAASIHESGGLPEVFIGCGVAIRREAFLSLGGYDPAFDYYAEEYDLAARLLLLGGRIGFDRRFGVMHHKESAGRDMNRILRRLVRNNAWVARRYAPDADQRREVKETVSRYARIARKERALRGYLRGLADLALSMRRQARTPMPAPLWDRFTGLAAARVAIQRAHEERPLGRVALIAPGKNAWAVARSLGELHVNPVANPADADTLVIATMSPGPMLDALAQHVSEHRRVIAPWIGAQAPIALARVLPASAAA